MIDLINVVDRAMQAAIRILEEARSSVSDEEYYVFMQVLESLQPPHTAPGWDNDRPLEALRYAVISIIDPFAYTYLDRARCHFSVWLGGGEDLYVAESKDRDDDIAHLNKMLAYWRSLNDLRSEKIQ